MLRTATWIKQIVSMLRIEFVNDVCTPYLPRTIRCSPGSPIIEAHLACPRGDRPGGGP